MSNTFNIETIKAGSLSITANREKNISMIMSAACPDDVRGNASASYEACKSLAGVDAGTLKLYSALEGFTDKALEACGWTSGFTSLVDAERGKIAKKVIRLAGALAIVSEAFEVVTHKEGQPGGEAGSEAGEGTTEG